MIIKLQPDQVGLFWDLIKVAMIESNKVPEKYQQDYSIKMLEKLLDGSLQSWVVYRKDNEGTDRIHAVLVSRIIDEEFYGIRILNCEAIYGYRFIEPDVIDEMFAKATEFAKANGCNVMGADFSIKRVKEMLQYMGFEEHRTICRKFIA